MSEILNILINVLIIAVFGGFCFVMGKAFSDCIHEDTSLEDNDYFESIDVIYTSKDKKEISMLLDKWRKKNNI